MPSEPPGRDDSGETEHGVTPLPGKLPQEERGRLSEEAQRAKDGSLLRRQLPPEELKRRLEAVTARGKGAPVPTPTPLDDSDDLVGMWQPRRPRNRRREGALLALAAAVGLSTAAVVYYVNTTLRPAGFEVLLGVAGVVFVAAIASAWLIVHNRDRTSEERALRAAGAAWRHAEEREWWASSVRPTDSGDDRR
ncbi:hypothetical protein [Kribbella sp. DT2]|uniref:hypothetical protein n=1 Tax=Kribbella sp. DT2 TaxID=3393427 RepID=UPI003CEB5876